MYGWSSYELHGTVFSYVVKIRCLPTQNTVLRKIIVVFFRSHFLFPDNDYHGFPVKMKRQNFFHLWISWSYATGFYCFFPKISYPIFFISFLNYCHVLNSLQDSYIPYSYFTNVFYTFKPIRTNRYF